MSEAALDDHLRRAAATQRLAVERALADLGVTPTQYAVLKTIAETPGLSNAGHRPPGAADAADDQPGHRQSRAQRRGDAP